MIKMILTTERKGAARRMHSGNQVKYNVRNPAEART